MSSIALGLRKGTCTKPSDTRAEATQNLVLKFGTSLCSSSGELVPTEDFLCDTNVIGLYFSAYWCPPSRDFTPHLCKKYDRLKNVGKKFEIIYVSSDSNEAEFKNYQQTMPFFSLPYAEREIQKLLCDQYNIRGIPALIMLDTRTGDVITKNGRTRISDDTYIEDFPYFPKPCYDISECTEGLNDSTSIVVLMEHASIEVQSKVTSAVTNVARKAVNENKGFNFFTGKGGGPISSIRRLINSNKWVDEHAHPLTCLGKGNHGWYCDGCEGGGADFIRYQCKEGCDFDYCEDCVMKSKKTPATETKKPVMIMLDFGTSRGFYKPAQGFEKVNEENLIAFMDAYKKGILEKETIKDM